METSQKIEASAAKSWGIFDRIYCISLTQRTDRREKASREFQRVGLGDHVQFMLVEKHPSNSEQGIFESHMACLRAGVEAGAQRILIFEDDVLFDRFSPVVLGQAAGFVKSNSDWHLFFLGCFVKSSKGTGFKSIRRIRYSCTAHAYAVNREFAEKLVQMPWSGIAYDDMLRSLNDGQFYTCYPSFAFQSGSATDNDKMRAVDRLRRIFGGGKRLQRWNEFSHRHALGLILGHLIFLLGIVLAVLVYKRWL